MFQKESTRFFLNENDKLVAEIRWEMAGDKVMNVNGTFVDPSQRGKGLAEKLVLEVIAKAKKDNIKIIPSCSYVDSYFEKHPEYAELLAK